MKDIVTEAEAKERWCPLARAVDEEIVVNRLKDGSPSIAAQCVASECMAWRRAHSDDPTGMERGYCGAFGLPRFT